jgi:hypothetical protein
MEFLAGTGLWLFSSVHESPPQSGLPQICHNPSRSFPHLKASLSYRPRATCSLLLVYEELLRLLKVELSVHKPKVGGSIPPRYQIPFFSIGYKTLRLKQVLFWKDFAENEQTSAQNL